jgi:hypothetical protein
MKPTSTMMPDRSAQFFERALRLLCASVACVNYISGGVAQASTILRWQIEATIIQVDDPLGSFPAIRLGDPVHGTLSYDLATSPVDLTDDKSFYPHAPSFRIATMVIDDPRTGVSIAFTGASEFEQNVHVYNDYEYGENDEVFDYLLALQDVIAPSGVDADWPVVSVELAGAIDVIQDCTLPLELNLNDWPKAILSFSDLLGDTAIYAEIYSLTPVAVPMVSGDFDFDGDVDGGDLLAWQDGFGFDDFLDADADKDLDVDGADFLIWQRGVSTRSIGSSSAANMSVPEPQTATFLMGLTGVLIARFRLSSKLARLAAKSAEGLCNYVISLDRHSCDS